MAHCSLRRKNNNACSKCTTQSTINSSYNAPLQVGATWYVATTGNDANSCAAPASPCATINGAIGKATSGDTVQIGIGTYTGNSTEVVLINKNITLSGGWDAGFITQNGQSIVDGQDTRRGITVNSSITAIIEHSIVQNGYAFQGAGVYNNSGSALTFNSSILRDNATNLGGGGGIYNNNGSVILNNSTVSDNSLTGIDNNGLLSTLTLNNSVVDNNNWVGISNSGGTVTLNNTTVINHMNEGGTGGRNF